MTIVNNTLDVQLKRFISQKCIGYQKGIDGKVIGIVDECVIETSDGEQKQCYQSHAVLESGYALPSTAFYEKCPRIDEIS